MTDDGKLVGCTTNPRVAPGFRLLRGILGNIAIDFVLVRLVEFGHRRVLIKQQDLDLLITPAVGKEGGKMLDVERQRLSRPLTQPEQEKALAALDAAEKFSAELRQRQGGQLFSDSTEIIQEMREERTRQLG
jgi:hypothetical protein